MKSIKYASSEHFHLIRNIAERTWPDTFGKIITPEQIQYMLGMMYSDNSLQTQLQQGHVFLLALLETAVSGFASYQLNYKGSASSKLHKLYVLPSAHGKGLGKLLINEVILISKTTHQKSILLNVNRNNPAINIYKHMGFKIIAEEDIDIGRGYFMNDFVMELSL